MSYALPTPCPATVDTTKIDTVPVVVNATRLVTTVPALALASNKPTKYHACVNTTTSGATTVLGGFDYTVYPAPTVTGVTPTGGVAAGNYSISIGGTGFTSKSTVTLGGVALTGVKATTDGTGVVATVPKWAGTLGAAQDIVVTTEGGASTGGTSLFTFSNGITLSPSTGKMAGGNVVSIKGAGFKTGAMAAKTWSAVAGNAWVVFSLGAYDPLTNGNGSAAQKYPAYYSCQTVTVVSDSELLCKMPDVHLAYPNGVSLTATVIDNWRGVATWTGAGAFAWTVPAPAAAPTFQTAASSGATYTFSSF